MSRVNTKTMTFAIIGLKNGACLSDAELQAIDSFLNRDY
jgi:hypothetical protein